MKLSLLPDLPATEVGQDVEPAGYPPEATLHPRPSARALFVTAWLPTESDWTATAGVARRQRLLIDALKALDIPIDVLLYVSAKRFDGSESMRRRIERDLCEFWQGRFDVTLCHWQPAQSQPSAWVHYVKPVLKFTWQSAFAKFAGPLQIAALQERLQRRPSLVLAHHLQCVVPLLLARRPLPPLFFDMDDVEHVSLRRSIFQPPKWPGKYLGLLQLPALLLGERQAIAASRNTFVCSEMDRRKLQRLFRTDSIEVVPNAVASHPPMPPSEAPVLMMLGHYNFEPNQLGAEYFLNLVWPLVKQAVPRAEAIIAGANSQLIRLEGSGENVTFAGYVTDLDALYRNCRAVVCPILSGGGTRLKVMEAAAYTRPVVSTSLGTEGIDLRDGEEIFVADTPDEFARRCISLLTDWQLAAAVGARARDAVERLYGREQVIRHLTSLFVAPDG